jgi:putative hemolysin
MFYLRKGHFVVKLADDYREVEDALRLRYEIFNLELNEGLMSSHLTGKDEDIYDHFCEHLLVIDLEDHDKVVGTYRLMLGSSAENSSGFYSESEFDLTAIKSLTGEKLELGRSCVDRGYRNGNVISLLWAGIARFIELHNVRHVFGCGSIHTPDPIETGIIYSYLNSFHRADPAYTVYPFNRSDDIIPIGIIDRKSAFAKLPALIKGYIRAGALLCGEPAVDNVFGTVDLFLLLQTENIMQRYKGRFFQELKEPAC